MYTIQEERQSVINHKYVYTENLSRIFVRKIIGGYLLLCVFMYLNKTIDQTVDSYSFTFIVVMLMILSMSIYFRPASWRRKIYFCAYDRGMYFPSNWKKLEPEWVRIPWGRIGDIKTKEFRHYGEGGEYFITALSIRLLLDDDEAEWFRTKHYGEVSKGEEDNFHYFHISYPDGSSISEVVDELNKHKDAHTLM